MSNSSCMKNSFCCLSAHGFPRVSQGQMPGGRRVPHFLNHLEGRPSSTMAAKARRFESQGVALWLLACPKGPCLGSCHSHCPHRCHTHLANRCIPLCDRPLKPKPLVRSFPPLIPFSLIISFFLVFVIIFPLSLSSLPYLNHKPSPNSCSRQPLESS